MATTSVTGRASMAGRTPVLSGAAGTPVVPVTTGAAGCTPPATGRPVLSDATGTPVVPVTADLPGSAGRSGLTWVTPTRRAVAAVAFCSSSSSSSRTSTGPKSRARYSAAALTAPKVSDPSATSAAPAASTAASAGGLPTAAKERRRHRGAGCLRQRGHVTGDPAHQVTGPGPLHGVEGQAHRMVEHLAAQFGQRVLAHLRRLPAAQPLEARRHHHQNQVDQRGPVDGGPGGGPAPIDGVHHHAD
jgi:hypothetical protein